ncbi:MAG: SusC/RagA family TonB-linked outer membrane protein [Ginsengibacter sp.]
MYLTVGRQTKNGAKTLKARTWMIMKLTIALLLFFIFQASAKDSNAQKITIVKKNVHLVEIFKSIELQTGFLFFYDRTLIQKTEPMNIDIKNASLDNALSACLKNLQLSYSIVKNTIVIQQKKVLPLQVSNVPVLIDPSLEIQGKVLDENGNPLTNASVIIKGSKNGTTTSASGEFSINVPGKKSTLIISFTGYTTQEVMVGDRANIDISMVKEDNSLSEVIVTALGIKRNRNTLPYAAQQVPGAEINKTRNANFINGLSGKISGLQVSQNNSLGGSTNVILRGYKSITQNNQALFVVDGIPFDNSNTNSATQQTAGGGIDYGNTGVDINPDDIESVTVLKGAAASALYGSRASNGVIEITTKKGTNKLNVVVNTGITQASFDKSTFPKYQHEYGAGYGPISQYGSPDGNFLYGKIFGGSSPSLVVATTEDASYGAKFDPNLLVYQWDAFYKGSPNFGKATPWVAGKNDPTTFFISPLSYNTSVFASAGGEKGSFKIGYTRIDDKGILPNSDIKKNMFSSGTTYKLTDKLTAGASFNYSNTDGLGRYGTGYRSNVVYNMRDWWQMNIDDKDQKAAYFNTGQNITWNMRDPFKYDNGGAGPAYTDNAYFSRYENYETDTRNRYFGNIYLNYSILDNLSIMGRISLDDYNSVREERNAIGSSRVPFYSVANNTFSEKNYDLLANYKANISTDLTLKALIGGNLRETNYNSYFATTNAGLVVPKLYTLTNSKAPITPPTQTETRIEVGGVFAGATLAYKEYLTLDLTGRRDQSSTLPQTNNAYFYPSVSGSFIFSKLLKNTPYISFGKLRANYAEVGNDAPAMSLKNVYNPIPSFGTVSLFGLPTTQNNPNLKPERTSSYEAGLEMSFLNSRVGFDVTYYNSNTSNQITQVNVSQATGYTASWVNFGSIKNKGVELSLFGSVIKTKDFNWNINLNWSKNNNKVISLYENTTNIPLRSLYPISINAQVGQPYGVIEGTDFVYTNGQRTVDSKGYYMVNSNSDNRIGNTTPDWTGGINNSFKYKDFNLSFLIDVRKGGDIFSYDRYAGLASGLYVESAGLNDLGYPSRNTLAEKGGIILPGVTADGKPNTVRVDNSQSWGLYGGFMSAAKGYVYDGGYVKLREVALTYSLPSSVIKRLHSVKGIDVSLLGRNLWIIHKNLPYADPEDNLSSGNALGYQAGSIPATRHIGINLKFTF